MTLRVAAGEQHDCRGQMVLLAGALVALALVAMLVAYLQLGYHADVRTGAVDKRAVLDGQSYLERVTHESARDFRGEYEWSERDQAVSDVRSRIRPQLDRLQRTGADSGVVYAVAFNQTVATRWAATNCPDGSGREFGPCVARQGVVVQERAGRTLVLAAGYDLTVTTERGETRLTTVERAVPR